MDLIDRYVYEVARNLPAKSDIPHELHSLLTDALEQRAEKEGRPADEAMAIDVLREFGKPEELALRYSEHRSLIGPELFPLFESVVWSILVIIAGAQLLGVVAPWVIEGRSPDFTRIGIGLWNYVKTAFIWLGLAVLGFAVLERTWTRTEPVRKQDWDPRDLPELPTEEDPSRLDLEKVEYSIWGAVLMLILLNVFPHWLGIISTPKGGTWTVVPASVLGINLPVAIINLWLVSRLVLNVFLWREREWARVLRWMEFAFGVLAIAALSAILAGVSPPQIDANWFTARGWKMDDDFLSEIASGKPGRIFSAVMWASLAWTVWQSFRRLWLLVREPLKTQTAAQTQLPGHPDHLSR
jgi:hypothetical protein